MYDTFEEWYDVFVDECKLKYGYEGPIFMETFEQDYEDGTSPQDAAKEFVESLK